MKREEIKKYLIGILGMMVVSFIIVFCIYYFNGCNIRRAMQTEAAVFIWIILAVNVIAILGFVAMLIAEKVRLPLIPEEYQKKDPILVCRCNSYEGCILLMVLVLLSLFLFWGGVANLVSEGIGQNSVGLIFCSLIGLVPSIFIWNYIAKCVLIFCEGGLVYRNIFGKVYSITDQEVQYVYILDYRAYGGVGDIHGSSRSFVRIHTSQRLISLPKVARNYYEAKEYAIKHYPSKETYERQKQAEVPKHRETKTEEKRVLVKDAENCLLQQTTSYQRDCPILFATNDKNELFFVYYFSNTFYIAKAAYENGKLNISYDFRRKHPMLESFQYRNWGERVTATLKLRGIEVDFTLQPKFEYHGMGCMVSVNQTSLYLEFLDYIDVYREHINEAGAMLNNEMSYLDLLKNVQEISDEDKKSIWALLDKGDSLEAIRRIQSTTGLGLADCKKIADNPYMYL